MRSPYIIAAALGALVTAIIWSFAAAWAGQIVFAPDAALLTNGQWFDWAAGICILYFAPIVAAWGLWKALTITSDEKDV